MDVGIAYYPEHWPRARWAEDFALMREAGITLARIGEFAWSRMEPRDGGFDFAWLEEAVAIGAEHGVRSVLCTPTQAPPPWLSANHPETRPWTPDGVPYSLGARAHIDATSPAALFYCDRIVRALGERFGRDARVVGWQLHNEIGAHTHFVSSAPWALAAFRAWLRRKYGTCAALNAAWGLVFWSGEVREWDEVEFATRSPVVKSPSYIKDLRTWGQEVWLEFLGRQTAILRPLCPGQWITHNIAWYGEQIDVWKLRDHLDVVGIDMYQTRTELVSAVDDLYHAVGRGKPWAVMEMPAGDGVWQDAEAAGYARGRLTATLVKHACAGAKLASLFRDQNSPSGQEQWGNGGLRDAWGRPTATVAAVREATRIIGELAPILARPRASDVAILFDSDDLIFSEMWPIEGRRERMGFNDYPRETQEIHHQFAKRGIRPTFASLDEDLSRYRVLVAWDKLLIDAAQADTLRAYVAQGGMLVGNYCLGHLTREGRRHCEPVPFRLTDVFGCTVRDLLRVQPGQAPRLAIGERVVEADRNLVTLEPLGGEVLATWAGWQGEHRAAIVGNAHGRGRTLYIGALLDRAGWDAVMPLLVHRFALVADNPVQEHPQVEAVPERGAWLVTNGAQAPVSLALRGRFRDLAAGRDLDGRLELPGWGMAVLVPRG